MTEPDGPLSDRLRARAEAFEPRPPALDEIRRKGTRRRWGRRAGVGMGAVVILAGVLAPLSLLSRLDDAPAGAAGDKAQSKLVFGSLVHDRYVVSTANGDGSDIKEIPIPITSAIDPSWSPDGSQIVFSGGEARNTEPSDLYIVNADGSELTRLTHDPGIVDWDPEWSPDGTTIAFSRDSDERSDHGIQRIAKLDVATGRVEVLPFEGYQAGDPSWSPDGSRIAFTGNVGGLGNIFVMNADGSNVHRLTDSVDRWGDNAPTWSPDGSMIAFDRIDESSIGSSIGNRPMMNVDIYVMDSDGSHVTQVTSTSAFEAAPEWSPDGTRIMFIGLIDDPTGYWRKSDLYTVRPDGSDITRLTTGAATGYSPNSFAAPSWTDASNADRQVADPSPTPTALPDATRWDETYRLSAFELVAAPTGPAGGGGDPEPGVDAVGVRFDFDWSGAIYPGEAQCRIDVMASDGTVVGSTETGVDSLSPHGHTVSPIPVSVDGDASTARGSCGPGSRPTGDYRFSNITIHGTSVSMTVSWGSETPPGAAWCVGVSKLADGSHASYPFTLSGGNAIEMDMRIPSSTVDFHVECEPYTNQSGEAIATVPDVIGLSFDEARAQIEAAGLEVGDVQVVTGGYIKEAVVEQDPPPGSSVDAGAAIDLVTGPSGDG
jgi:Tol biopolymer transport system component